MTDIDYEFDLNDLIDKNIVVTWSGGMDTTGLIPFMIENYQSVLYPIFVKRGQKNSEKEEGSVDYYTKVFVTKYNEKFKEPFKVNVTIPPFEFKQQFPNELEKTHSLRNSDIVNQAVRYALLKEINFIVVGSVLNDENWKDNSSKYWKTKTEEVRIGTNVKNLHIIPVFLVLNYDKAKIIQWCNERGIDLSRTWSCYFATEQHCGECPACDIRRDSFKKAGVTDNTGYLKYRQ